MSLLEFFEWLGNTPWSVALLESIWVYPLVETTHVLTLCLFLGMIATLDLRLVGLTLRNVPVSEVAGRLLPWAFVGFALMVVSGVLLFYSHPVRAFENVLFRINRRVTEWDRAPVTPVKARLAGYFSLMLWTTVVVSGRMQAYNWFN